MAASNWSGILKLGEVPRWVPVTVLCLGLLSALLESASLITFIPLLQSLAPETSIKGLPPISFLGSGQVPSSWIVLTVLCGLIVFKNLSDLANTYLVKRTEGLIAHRLRVRILDATLLSSIERKQSHDQADIMTVMSTSSWKVGTGSVHIFRLMVAAVTSLVLLATMTAISPRLTGVALALLGVTLLIIRGTGNLAERTGRIVVAENRALGNRMLESLSSLQLIRAFGNERYEIERFSKASESLRHRMLRLDFLWALPASIAEVTIVAIIACLILAGSALGVGVAALVAFLSILFRLQTPARALLENKLALDGLKGAYEDVQDFLEQARTHGSMGGAGGGTIKITKVARGIRFENVSFRYHGETSWALQDVSFEIAAGEMTGIVGGSGAGKTTLMLLLFRFHEPTSGRILVDGVPLADLDLASWRSQLALMAQEVHLLNATIAENIGYGDLSASREQIRAAAEVAGIAHVIETMPAGYETAVGTGGFRLSGGQRQRVALARALLKDPSVLLLDEATNALDIEAEERFRMALDTFGSDRTVIAIAHRLTTLRAASKIVVLHDGRVAEVGTPRELLKQQGRFSGLHERQNAPAWLAEP